MMYNNERTQDLMKSGLLDSQTYPQIVEKMSKMKTADFEVKPFPAKQEEIKYPESALKIGNPLYLTSSKNYGSQLPSQQDMPQRYVPRPPQFSKTFCGGNYKSEGLTTAMTPSRVHKELDH